jgi:hypothetical protein
MEVFMDNKEKLTNANDLLEEIKDTDPERYNKIVENVAKRSEEFKKRGGKREGSGRKKLYANRVKATFDLDESDVINLKDYAKKHKISKNKALHEAINNLIRNEA